MERGRGYCGELAPIWKTLSVWESQGPSSCPHASFRNSISTVLRRMVFRLVLHVLLGNARITPLVIFMMEGLPFDTLALAEDGF